MAISSYLLTGVLGVLGWFAMQGGSRRALILGVGIFAGLMVSALRLGTMKRVRHRAEI